MTLLAASAALLAAFVVIETRVEAPLMPLRIFQSTTLAGANAVSVLLGGSFFAFIFIGTLYMQQVLGYSALKAGLAWLAASLTSVAFAGLSQALVTRGSGAIPAAALTSGFQWAFWACGAIGLAAVPATFLLVHRDKLATAVASTSQKPQPAPAEV